MLDALIGELCPEDGHFPFQEKISLRQFLVHCPLVHESTDFRIGLIGHARDIVGRRKPHAPLITVVLEHQHEAHDLEQHEYEPIVVFLQKLEEVAHSGAFISSGTNTCLRF